MTDAHSKVYCIIGNPVRHSMSPHVHNAAFSERGINAVYVAFEVEDVEKAVRGIRALGIGGASVTIPHKLSVMPQLDEIDEVAQMIGAVNTIVNEDGRLFGLNTDGPGAVKAIKDAGIELEGRNVAMIGSGGAARAVGFALAATENVADITVLGIVRDELSRLAGELGEKTGATARGIMLEEQKEAAKKAVEEAGLVINASPMGMHPHENETPVPAEWVTPDTAVLDVVYTPLETRFLKEVKAKGCRTVQGVEMFLNQAVLQFERWTRESAPVELMRRIVIENLEAK